MEIMKKRKQRVVENPKITYDSYFHYQNFSSDEPTARINNSPWHLKYEDGVPAFYFRYQDTFKQVSFECFITNANNSRTFDFSNWQSQVEAYFNKPLEEVKKCLIKAQQKIKKSSIIN